MNARAPFPLQLPLRYCKRMPRMEMVSCDPATIGIGSKIVVFQCHGELHCGERLEICLEWPALLDRHIPLNVIVSGRVMECEEGVVSLRIEVWEFRTRASGLTRAAGDSAA